MNKADIYSDSYLGEPEPEEKSMDEIRHWKSLSERQKVGLLLKEEKLTSARLRQKNQTLMKENRRLNTEIKNKSQQAAPHLKKVTQEKEIVETKNRRLTEENQRLTEENRRMKEEIARYRRR